jgi:hypothetical protein
VITNIVKLNVTFTVVTGSGKIGLSRKNIHQAWGDNNPLLWRQ